MIERNVLLPLVENFITNKCISNCLADDDEQEKLKSFIKKDENSCYSIFDKDHSIKCVFDKKFLDNYLGEQPSHIKFESFESKIYLYFRFFNSDKKILSRSPNCKKCEQNNKFESDTLYTRV
jgi:hypothetical protein